jgi:hypothetical protein
MAGSSSYSSSVLDSEDLAERFIEQASQRRLRRRSAVENLRYSRWEWPISSLSTSTDAHSSLSYNPLDDLLAPDYFPEESGCTEVTTLQSRSPSPELHSSPERFDADHSLIETLDLRRSSRPGWPSSEAGSVFDLGSPRPLSPFDDPPFGGYSSEVSPIAIWDSDLVSDGAQTPSPVIPFTEYIDMMSPPYTDDFTMLDDASPLSTPASDNMRIWESDLMSATPSPASRSSDTPEIHSATSLGGFSFQDEAPSMEGCSFVGDDEASLHSPDYVLSPGSMLSSDSVPSPANSGRFMEGLTFEDEWWVQDSIADLEEQYAHSIEHENTEGLPVLLPSPPFSTPSQAATPLISFSVPVSPAYTIDTPELLRQVSARLAGLVEPISAVSSPIVQPASSPAAAPPKSQRRKLILITDFSIPYPVCAYPKRKPTKSKQKQKAQAPASPQPQAIPEALIRFYCPDTAESSRGSGTKRAIFAKETYPQPEPQPKKAEQQPASDLASTQPQASGQKLVRSDIADTSVPFPTSEKKKVNFAKPSRCQSLVHAAAEHFHYPKTGNPLRAWLKSLSAPKEEKPGKERQASVVHPLLKQPEQERLKSCAQTQVNTAIAMGKMAVAGLFTAGLFFALQRATGWREVDDSWL